MDEVIERAAERGQAVTPVIRGLLAAWEQNVGNTPAKESAGVIRPNGSTYIQLGMFPIPCTCMTCEGQAVIFPPDDSCPHMSNGLSGYVLCPHCSFGLEKQVAA